MLLRGLLWLCPCLHQSYQRSLRCEDDLLSGTCIKGVLEYNLSSLMCYVFKGTIFGAGACFGWGWGGGLCTGLFHLSFSLAGSPLIRGGDSDVAVGWDR